MTQLDPLGRVLDMLKSRVSGARVNKTQRTSAASGTSAASQKTAADYVHIEDLKARVIDAIEKIDPHAEDRTKKAMRILVENVLVWKFGLHLVNDPAFMSLVEEVSSSLFEDPVAQSALNSLFAKRSE
jgi:sugar phosphate isomerase/epimerase